MISKSLFGTLLFYKKETSLVKEKFEGLELLLELLISAVDVEVHFLRLGSDSWMVTFPLLHNVTAWHFSFPDLPTQFGISVLLGSDPFGLPKKSLVNCSNYNSRFFMDEAWLCRRASFLCIYSWSRAFIDWNEDEVGLLAYWWCGAERCGLSLYCFWR